MVTVRRARGSEQPAWLLVGRDTTVALLDKLVSRDGGPVPTVVVYGPGGIGKTALLSEVANRYRMDAPVASVDLDDGPPRAWHAVLDDAHDRLTSQRFGSFGRITMPRYELIRSIQREYPLAHTSKDRRLLARSVLAGRSEALATAGDLSGLLLQKIVPAPADDVVGSQGVFRRLFGRARPLPALRWLLGGGVGYARALRWFERTATIRLSDFRDGNATDVVQACWRLMDQARTNRTEPVDANVGRTDDESGDDQPWAATVVDRLAVEAFLHDIASQYPWWRRLSRRVNCVLLLDGADLLSPQDGRLVSSDRDRQLPTRGDDVLELLAQAKQRVPNAPLLVVATKQAAPPSTEHAHLCCLDESPDDGADAQVADVLKTWRYRWTAARAASQRSAAGACEFTDEQVDSAYLHVTLRAFSQTQTARVLASWDVDSNEAQLWELHQVTHGHPLALKLITDALNDRARDKGVRGWPVIRTLLDAPVSGRPDAAASETIADYLLFKTFFQRFPDDPISRDGVGKTDRVRTRKVLANLAAARKLDRPTLELLAPNRVHDKMWDDLISYSFITRSADGQILLLDPLLRVTC